MRNTSVPTKREYFWQELPKYIRLIYFIAKKMSKSYEEFADNSQQALLLFGESANKYDFNRESSLKSYIGVTIHNGLIKYKCKKNREVLINPQNEEEEEEWFETIPSNEPPMDEKIDFYHSLENLSSEAKEVIHLIFDSPNEIWEIINSQNRKTHRRNIIEYVRKEYGWGLNKSWKIMNEIQSILQRKT